LIMWLLKFYKEWSTIWLWISGVLELWLSSSLLEKLLFIISVESRQWKRY
jgi:hypothetical protein